MIEGIWPLLQQHHFCKPAPHTLKYELVKWHAHVQPAKLFPKTFSVETVSRISFCDLSFLNFSQNVSRGCLLNVRRIHTAQGTSPPHCGCAAMCRTRCISPPHLGVVVHKKSMSWERKKRLKRLKRLNI